MSFVIMFIFFFIFGTFTLVGWYLTTRGESERLPDGTLKTNGRLLKHWSLYWNKTLGHRHIFYTGERLKEKYLLCDQYIKNASPSAREFTKRNVSAPGITLKKDHISLFRWPLLTIEQVRDIEVIVQAKVLYEHAESEKNTQMLYFFIEEKKYRFPEWIRQPIASCITCFSSIYGSLFYWFVILQFGGAKDCFYWSINPFFSALFFWAVWCFSLSCTTTFIVKIMNRK